MIALQNITLMRGPQTLLEDASIVIQRGQRVGVIGRNGCGKTSLFKTLCGEIALEQGQIDQPEDLRLSVMAQETPGSDRSALDFVIDAHTEYRRLEASIQTAEANEENLRLAQLHQDLDDIDGYTVPVTAQRLLGGLGFAVNQFDEPVEHFSGGWRVRLNLAAALMCPSDLLMLDEPTNHLDLEATVWLEQWLKQYEGTLLLISHDRQFLDGIIDRVFSFEGKQIVGYTGNYSAYEKLRAEKLSLQQAAFEKQQKRKEEIERFVNRFRYKESKAKQAQSRLKELQRMQDIAPAHVDSPFQFNFPEVEELPSYLLQIEGLSFGYESALTDAIILGVRSDSRIGLLGYNGSGKSTLLKVLAGKLDALSGEIIRVRKLRLGYFAQHQVDELPATASPLQVLQKFDTTKTEQEIRNFLGGFDFRGSRVDEKIAHFSGGEKARVALAKVAWQKPNLLLLDEPTNHLDLDMCHALTMALQDFQGAMIVVSHDRHLMGNTVDQFYSIHEGKFTEFKGDLHEYESWVRRENSSDKAQSKTVEQPPKVDKKAQRQEAAAQRRELAPLRKESGKLETQMTRLQKELKTLDERLADESLYAPENKTRLTEILQEQGALRGQLEQTEEQWLELQEKLGEAD